MELSGLPRDVAPVLQVMLPDGEPDRSSIAHCRRTYHAGQFTRLRQNGELGVRAQPAQWAAARESVTLLGCFHCVGCDHGRPACATASRSALPKLVGLSDRCGLDCKVGTAGIRVLQRQRRVGERTLAPPGSSSWPSHLRLHGDLIHAVVDSRVAPPQANGPAMHAVIRTCCPACNARIRAPAALLGAVSPCPRCRGRLVVRTPRPDDALPVLVPDGGRHGG